MTRRLGDDGLNFCHLVSQISALNSIGGRQEVRLLQGKLLSYLSVTDDVEAMPAPVRDDGLRWELQGQRS